MGALHGARGAVGGSATAGRLRRALVVGEVGLAMLLLAGAGLLLRSFYGLTRVDPGFRSEGVLSLELSLPQASYPEPAAQSRFFEAAVERIAALPGVQSAGAISWRPLTQGSATSFELVDRPAPEPGQEPVALVRMVTPDLLRTLAIPLRAGRGIDARDADGTPRVVLINEALAREHFPDRSPVGQRLRMEWGELLDAEIVGVVADARLVALDAEPRATLYWPLAQLPNSFMTLLVRSRQPPGLLVTAVREQVAALDPSLPVANVEPLAGVVAASLRQPRFTLQLLLAFAATAAALAGLGLYGVVAYGARQRTAEMGVRLALGARSADVLRLVLGDGLRLTLLGVGLGLVLALGATRLLASQLYEVSPSDPLSYAAVALLLVAVSLVAGWLPARRAARVDPVRALRVE
jgi:predicted permease